MRTSLACLLSLVSLVAVTGCAAPADEDEGAREDAISAAEAAAKLAGKTVALVERFPASREAKSKGIVSWTVYGADVPGFQGSVLFGLDGDGDVAAAVYAAYARWDRSTQVALVRYDKRGPVAARDDDRTLLASVAGDVSTLAEVVRKAEADSAVVCIAAVAVGTLAAVSALGAVILASPVSFATAPAWVLAASEALEVAAAFGGAAAIGTVLVTVVGGAEVPAKLFAQVKTACEVVALPQ